MENYLYRFLPLIPLGVNYQISPVMRLQNETYLQLKTMPPKGSDEPNIPLIYFDLIRLNNTKTKLNIFLANYTEEIYDYIISLVEELQEDKLVYGEVRGIVEQKAVTIQTDDGQTTTIYVNEDVAEKLGLIKKTIRKERTIEIEEKIKRLAQKRQEAIDERGNVPKWISACQSVSIDPRTAKKHASDLRENWKIKTYKWQGFKD